MKISSKDVKQVEREYALATLRWGEKNQVTLRAMSKYYDLKTKYEEQKINKKGNKL